MSQWEAAVAHERPLSPQNPKLFLPCRRGCPSCGSGASEGTPCRSMRPEGGGWHRPVLRFPRPPLAVCWLPWLPLHLSPHMERLVAWKTSWKKRAGDGKQGRGWKTGGRVSNIKKDDIICWHLEWRDGGNKRIGDLCGWTKYKWTSGRSDATVCFSVTHLCPFSLDKFLSAILSLPEDLQTRFYVLQYIYHGGHSAFPKETRPLLQMKPACSGIVEEMTTSWQWLSERNTDWETGKKEKEKGAICIEVIICIYENLRTIEELEENS